MAQFFWKARGIGPSPGASQSYSTAFPLTESPISEGGKWAHQATAWAQVNTSGGHAFGTQADAVNDNDSYAYLASPTFSADQAAQGVVWVGGSIGNFCEIEILLRVSDGTSFVKAYECNANMVGPYAQIVRWNGPLNDFTFLAQNFNAFDTIAPPATGDIIKATISGFTINSYINKNDGNGFQLLATATDTDAAKLASGQPGMAMFTSSGTTIASLYGFSSWTTVP